jgi:hypothetical protein
MCSQYKFPQGCTQLLDKLRSSRRTVGLSPQRMTNHTGGIASSAGDTLRAPSMLECGTSQAAPDHNPKEKHRTEETLHTCSKKFQTAVLGGRDEKSRPVYEEAQKGINTAYGYMASSSTQRRPPSTRTPSVTHGIALMSSRGFLRVVRLRSPSTHLKAPSSSLPFSGSQSPSSSP